MRQTIIENVVHPNKKLLENVSPGSANTTVNFLPSGFVWGVDTCCCCCSLTTTLSSELIIKNIVLIILNDFYYIIIILEYNKKSYIILIMSGWEKNLLIT